MKYCMLLVVGVALSFTGCLKPYHEATLVDIGTSEVAILVQTVNDNGQAVIAPPEKGDNQKADGTEFNFYTDKVVNARKVEIPYYWKQTKRVLVYGDATTGEWRPAARLIVVDTQPETREWKTGQAGSSNADQAIWVESSDSVGFSTGISVTARIANKTDAITFLSNYPPKDSRVIESSGGADFNVEVTSLQQVMDEEVRNKIQEVYAEMCAAYEMDDLRAKKVEVLQDTEKVVVEFFKERGVSITTLGQFGGYAYENPKIQESIDKVFQAQQDKQVAIAEAEAAQERKLALQLKGEGAADQVKAEAEGKAEAVKLGADAEAEAIKAVADAKAYEIEKASEDLATYLELKRLEIEMERLKTWDGRYPSTLMGGDTGNLLFSLPIPTVEK